MYSWYPPHSSTDWQHGMERVIAVHGQESHLRGMPSNSLGSNLEQTLAVSGSGLNNSEKPLIAVL